MKRLQKLFMSGLVALSAGCTNTNVKPIPYVQDSAVKQQDKFSTLLNVMDSDEYTMDNPYIEVNPYEINPLSVFIYFKDVKDDYTITLVSNDHPLADLSYYYQDTDTVKAAITGLNVDQDTTIVISNSNQSNEYVVKADSLSENAIAKATITANDTDFVTEYANHLVFTSPSASGYISGYDLLGNLRCVFQGSFTWDINVNNQQQLVVSNDTLVALPYYMSGFYTMDLTGRISRQVVVSGGYHHDIDQLDNGNYLIASNHLNGDTVEDVIVEIDPNSGEIVKTFDLTTIIDQNTGKSLNWTAKDWFHNNSVEYDPINNTLVLSGRHQDIVAILDYDSQEIVGLVGDSQGWDEKYLAYFYSPIGDDFEFQWAQHAASYNDQHQLILFDNGIYRSKDKTNTVDAVDNYSRFVIYEIDESNHTIQQVYQYGKERGYQYYSPYICDVDQIINDTYLVTSGGISYKDGKINNLPGALTDYDVMEAYVSIVDNHDLYWEMKLDTNIYRSEFIDVNSVQFTNEPYGLVGQLEESEYSLISDLNLKDALNSKEANQLGFSLSYDDQRVVLDAKVDRKDTLKLITVSKDTIRSFDIQNYQDVGMCVSIFNEEDEKNHLIKSIQLNQIESQTHFYYLYNDQLYDSGFILDK